ncbi:hypothetical protein XENOCAPTIV_011350, partial [Xenoophorus captivus]
NAPLTESSGCFIPSSHISSCFLSLSAYSVFQQRQQQWNQQSRKGNRVQHQAERSPPEILHKTGARRLCQLLAALSPWPWAKRLLRLHQQSSAGGALQQPPNQRVSRLNVTLTSSVVF